MQSLEAVWVEGSHQAFLQVPSLQWLDGGRLGAQKRTPTVGDNDGSGDNKDMGGSGGGAAIMSTSDVPQIAVKARYKSKKELNLE